MKIFLIGLIALFHPGMGLADDLSASVSEESTATTTSEIEKLNLPEMRASTRTLEEKFYAVQPRSNLLSNRLEINLGGSKNFSPGSFLISQELKAGLKYFLSERFFVTVNGSYVSNDLSSDGDHLWKREKIFPDISCVKNRVDGTIGYNLFYGKFRMSMDTVLYFDQYWAIGGAWLRLANHFAETTAFAPVGTAGLTVWFNRNWNTDLSLKDYYAPEFHPREPTSTWAHHMLGTLTIGYLFGGGDA